MISRALTLMLLAALGGLLGWAVIEPTVPNALDSNSWARFEWRLAAVTGLFIGMAIGGASGWFQGSRSHMLKGAGIGGLLGLIVGPMGISLGGAVYQMVTGPTAIVPGVGTLGQYVGRVVGFAIFGGLLGLAEGFVGRSSKRAIQGLMGGLLGGALGGFAFQAVADAIGPLLARGASAETGRIPRAVGLTIVGGGIGLLIGLVEMVSRQAWVRLVLGRNEGREWAIDAPQTFIGRDERAHIPLFGDLSVGPLHATIVKQADGYWLHDAGTPTGIGLNNQRIQAAPLTSGDVIQVGTHQLQFLLRGGQARRVPMTPAPQRFEPAPMPHVPAGQPVGPMPMSSNPTVAMAPATAAPVLVATNGPLTGQRFPVMAPIEVGRELPTIPLGFGSGVSRRHAGISPGPGGLEVRDLGSTNGVLVNGTRGQQFFARLGDTIQIGSTIFRVEA